MAALFPCLAAGERSSRRKETPMRKEHNYGQQQQQRPWPWASVVLLVFFNGKRVRYLGAEDAANEHVRAREWASHTKVTAIHCAYTSTDILHYWQCMVSQANMGNMGSGVKVNHEHQNANPCRETSTMWLLSARKKCWHTTSTTTIAELNAFSLAEKRFNVRALHYIKCPLMFLEIWHKCSGWREKRRYIVQITDIYEPP